MAEDAPEASWSEATLPAGTNVGRYAGYPDTDLTQPTRSRAMMERRVMGRSKASSAIGKLPAMAG